MKLHLNNRSDTLLIHSWFLGPAEPDADGGTLVKAAVKTAAKTAEKGTPHDDTGYRIRIADICYAQSLIVTPRSVKMWDVKHLSALALTDFQYFAELGAEVIILGVGKSMAFPEVALTRPLVHRQIGLEVMDTAAACRTYNVLAGDGRPVVAALIL